MTRYNQIERMALSEFADIVESSQILQKRSLGSAKLRLHLIDKTYMDIWVSGTGKYSYHWEQRSRRGLILRHDNAPDHPEIDSFPRHFHDGEEQKIGPSHLGDDPVEAVRLFLEFTRKVSRQND